MSDHDEQIDSDDEEGLAEDELWCALTDEVVKSKPAEVTLQAIIEQLHREYRIELQDMERDVWVQLEREDKSGKVRRSRKKVSLVVYEPGQPHETDNIIRVVVVAGSKPTARLMGAFDEILGNLPHEPIYGMWTNGDRQTFRMRTRNAVTDYPEFTELTDFPAPHETLEDLNDANRRPLRVATKESLVRTFKACHDYLYGNQQMRGDKAFWQLLYLIFCKIYDEQNSLRRFFVGATEGNTEEGQEAIAKRIKGLFDQVKAKGYDDVFDATDRIALNDRALAYIAGELGRYSFLGTDADAKGTAYESIIAPTLKRERGQFFTPRNVISMMVRMLDPGPDDLVLDPACGSGGFLVVVLHHVRRRLLEEIGADPDLPVPSELKRIEKKLQQYARSRIYGIDNDADLRKAARMNMIMNNDGHGNILSFNSLEYGVADREVPEMDEFRERTNGGLAQFDMVLANPPFGAKIPIKDPKVLEAFDLGHTWERSGDTWVKTGLQKSVPPEILFIEACCKYLKPGTGKMAIVLPNGPLGNPGQDKEVVRWWMLQNMELLASIDLAGEAFQPQVSVQASCVLLRRRDPDEHRMTESGKLRQRPVFMAIAESVGHDRRGKVTTERGPDGKEIIYTDHVRERWEEDGEIKERVVQKRRPHVDDDLPWIAEQYLRHVQGESFESEKTLGEEV